MAKIVEKKVFEVDGIHFETRKKASIYNSGIELMQALMQEGFRNNDGSLKNVCLKIAEKMTSAPHFQKAVKSIRNAHSMKS